jgi:hypothetical protein
VRLHIDCHPSTVKILDQELNTNEDVLRWSTLKQAEGLPAVKNRLEIRPTQSLRLARKLLKEGNPVRIEDGLVTRQLWPRILTSSHLISSLRLVFASFCIFLRPDAEHRYEAA